MVILNFAGRAVLQSVWCCRRCGVAGSEQVPQAPLGWYFRSTSFFPFSTIWDIFSFDYSPKYLSQLLQLSMRSRSPSLQALDRPPSCHLVLVYPKNPEQLKNKYPVPSPLTTLFEMVLQNVFWQKFKYCHATGCFFDVLQL